MFNEFHSLDGGHLEIALCIPSSKELLICIDKDHSAHWRILPAVFEWQNQE